MAPRPHKKLRLTTSPNRTLTPDGAELSAQSGTPNANSTAAGAHANEPSGMTFLSDMAFISEDETTWTIDDDWSMRHANPTEHLNFTTRDTSSYTPTSQVSIDPIPTPPFGASVGEIKFPQNFGSGSAPTAVSKDFPASTKSVYFHLWLCLSSNWSGVNTSAINKLFYVDTMEHPPFVLSAQGTLSNPLRVEARMQNMRGLGGVVDGSFNLARNLGSSGDDTLTRNVWTEFEGVLVMESAYDTYDGGIHIWQDGIKIIERDDVAWMASSSYQFRFRRFEWEPTYGGSGNPVPHDQYHWWNRCYLSTSTSRVTVP